MPRTKINGLEPKEYYKEYYRAHQEKIKQQKKNYDMLYKKFNTECRRLRAIDLSF